MKNKIHALYSPSSAHRWYSCSASPHMEDKYDEDSTINLFAQEGILAHKRAAEILHNPDIDISKEDEYIMVYVRYVLDILAETKGSKLHIEHIINIAPNCFGTADAVVISSYNREIHIIDLKYGQGEYIKAQFDEQLTLYAIGMWVAYSDYDFTLHIVQPRLNNISHYQIPQGELEIDHQVLKKKIQFSEANKDRFTPSKGNCQYCKHNFNCHALENHMKKFMMQNKQNLEGKKELLRNKSFITLYMDLLEKNFIELMKQGEEIEGFTLAKGRSTNVWADEDAEQKVIDLVGPELSLVTKIRSPAQLKKQLIDLHGDQTFNDLTKQTIPNDKLKQTVKYQHFYSINQIKEQFS